MESGTDTSAIRLDGVSRSGARAGAQARLSVVIPALNEAGHLPGLLAVLESQTRPPDEIIIADAGSVDATRAIALGHGAHVVDGGMPGVGRNAGARAATGDIIVFMDADAEPTPDLLERAIAEFEARELSAATAPLRASEGETFEVDFWCAFAEAYIRALQHIAPHAVGLFIVVRRDVHEKIGGFDETVILAEDHEYARRASKAGKFGILRSVKVKTSMRRAHHEGRLKIARVFVFSELRTLRGIPIRDIPFPYQFGVFVPEDQDLTLSNYLVRLFRMLRKPSTEKQTDALFTGIVALIAGVIGTAWMVLAGVNPLEYWPFALLCAAVLVESAIVAARKLRFERHYGPFFMASVAISDVDIFGNDGTLIVRKGVDEVCEVHAIGSLDRMAELNHQGMTGMLTIALETLHGIREMAEDMGDPFYDKVRYVMGYSNLTKSLFKVGFTEITDPPRMDWINRWYKPIMTRRLAKRMGRDLNDDVDDYRMVIATKEYCASDLIAAVDTQIARVERNLERAARLAAAAPKAAASVEAADADRSEPAAQAEPAE
jgi:glycosyltransferase involved in cell wall biosynthesis